VSTARPAQQTNTSRNTKQNLWWGGSVFGELRPDGNLIIHGSSQGKIQNGNIWVGGSIEGKIENNGSIRKGGSIVGKVEDNGNIRLGGSIVGKIEDNGKVWRGGSVVGKVDNMTDKRKIAVIYFFGFYRF
jgi:cytoskeletal protein CcmA (bactofilin family)